MSTSIGLYWFTNDLRLDDNPLLRDAVTACDQLLFWYNLPEQANQAHDYGVTSPKPAPCGEHRWRFLVQSLHELDARLQAFNHFLWVEPSHRLQHLQDVVETHKVSVIYQSVNAGWWEKHQLQRVKRLLPHIRVVQVHTHTVFSPEQLPFELAKLPLTFTQFRKKVETIGISAPMGAINTIPSPPTSERPPLHVNELLNRLPNQANPTPDYAWHGGEASGNHHVKQYFSTAAARRYKQTRNAFEGEQNSTKFSLWLANGCLSARRLVKALNAYEQRQGANESTYWILFELYWREYFQWYAHRFGAHVFSFSGIKSQKPLTSYYGDRFAMWRSGTTPYPIVNACMKQLRATGYMSNRGRQLVASCLIHELGIDWRYGARYFEQQLIDYDVASNWGNWQYLAGVGVDPRGCRRFDLTKQAERYDPEGEFVQRWAGDQPPQAVPLNSVDPADWPVA